jgi:hypothetical protein
MAGCLKRGESCPDPTIRSCYRDSAGSDCRAMRYLRKRMDRYSSSSPMTLPVAGFTRCTRLHARRSVPHRHRRPMFVRGRSLERESRYWDNGRETWASVPYRAPPHYLNSVQIPRGWRQAQDAELAPHFPRNLHVPVAGFANGGGKRRREGSFGALYFGYCVSTALICFNRFGDGPL